MPGGLEAAAPLYPAKGTKSTRPLIVLMYVVLLLVAVRSVYAIDAGMGQVVFYMLIIPLFFLLPWPNHPVVLYLGLSALLAGKLVYAATTDPLFGPDANQYFNQVSAYVRLDDFMAYAQEHIATYFLDASAYPIFGLLYMPYYKFLNGSDPLTMATLNTLILIGCCNLTYVLNKTYFRYEMPFSRLFYPILLCGVLVSPSFMYLSSVFAKDVTCVALGLLSAYLLLKKKYVWFLLVILYSTMLRDYSIVYSLGFYALFGRKIKLTFAMLIGSIGILTVKVGLAGLLNAVLLTAFLFISPNPLSPDNWDSSLVLRTLEALYMMCSLVMSAVIFIRYKETRLFYSLCLMLLYSYACVLVLVGYISVTGKELEYAVGTIGDNMVRKKLPVLPMLYMMNAYTVAWWLKFAYRKGRGEMGHEG